MVCTQPVSRVSSPYQQKRLVQDVKRVREVTQKTADGLCRSRYLYQGPKIHDERRHDCHQQKLGCMLLDKSPSRQKHSTEQGDHCERGSKSNLPSQQSAPPAFVNPVGNKAHGEREPNPRKPRRKASRKCSNIRKRTPGQRKEEERSACNKKQCKPAGEPEPNTEPEDQIREKFEEQ